MEFLCFRHPVLAMMALAGAAAWAQVPPGASVRQPGAPPWLIVEAEDDKLCRLEGPASVVGYPPQRLVVMKPGAVLALTFDADTLYLRLPLEFTAPGPGYGLGYDGAATESPRLRAFIDGKLATEFFPFRSPREFALAEGLAPGPHTLRLECLGSLLGVDGFRLAAQPLSRVEGVITADLYPELLVNVRTDVSNAQGLVRTEYLRTPHDGGSVQIVGLPPDEYRLRFTAAGWKPLEVPAVRVERAGQVVDLGVLTLRMDWRTRGQAWYGDAGPHFGRTITVAPGESFRTRVFMSRDPAQQAWLKSRHKTIRLQVRDVVPEDFGRWNGVGTATFIVPADAPLDMYDLQVGGRLLPQAVCVREPLPERFDLAGISHFHVWGQQQAEIVQRMAEMAQLAGARAFLMANEVNPAYLAGALTDLRIPYATCRGNHMMSRWSDYFGWACTATDDGPLSLVSFGGFPYESWAEPRELLQARPQATCRVIVCYEGFAPIDFIREQAVDVLFDGHSDDPHPDLAQFPPGTLHFRAPGGPYVRWIPMTHSGLDPSMKRAQDIPLLYVPREGPAPLRVEFSHPNDGTATANSARIINETDQRFPAGQLRLEMKAGDYAVTGARVRQAFDSDDRTRRLFDLEVDLPAKGEAQVECHPAR